MNVTSSQPQQDVLLKFATEIVAAYVGGNPVPAGELPALIKNVYATLVTLDGSQTGDQPALKPAVPIKKSVTDAYIICLEDGKRLKMLKRYLRARYNMTPDDYRAKWGLPLDYPMVAPNYAAQRSEFAKKIGLGKSHVSRKTRRRG